ncbi:helicase associated domain-containing protein [Streptomyces sp. NPDC006514]|uniref:helicase associated domain-containing protein n=1 Tax=Streptomyces sp. NPDC006514 TaxID=3154308 RepID=UPI0033A68CF5
MRRWLSDQRRAYRAGAMTGERAAELEEPGIVWDTADAGFETNLGAARAYYELHGTLAAPRGATILDIAIGQYLTNNRRPAESAKTLTARSGEPRRSPPSTPTGTRGRSGGRSTGSGTTPTSPSSWPKAPARPRSCRE